MRASSWVGRWSTRPLTLWVVYAVVLLGVTLGLAALSRHALQLNRQQWLTSQRETLEQDVRVALWRLDSRLAPYLATLHDAAATHRFASASGSDEDFVIERFVVREFSNKSGEKRLTYAPSTVAAAGRMGMDLSQPDSDASDRQSLSEKIPVQRLAKTVKTLLPEVEPTTSARETQWPANSLVQSYSIDQLPLLPQARAPQRELSNRAIAVQQQLMNANPFGLDLPPVPIRLTPFWIDGELVLVRSRSDTAESFEGVWLDWKSLQRSLQNDIDDLLPRVSFQAIEPEETPDPARALAALPVAIVPQPTVAAAPDWSPTHTALLLSWLGLVVAAVVVALALGRLIALSERRASFVSAVTHELRTPLTTFRLYSDLLARDMVPSEQDRKEYLQTLRREADRLSHLVDNVLRYSRLERSTRGPALESVTLSAWIERVTPRLRERLHSAEMTLVVRQDGDGHWLTDPAALEQLVFNLIDNAAKYAKESEDRRVHLDATFGSDQVTLSVTDHGNGVPADLRRMIFKPFAKSAERAAETAAGVGLGLALARQTAAALRGTLAYEQREDGGARFKLTLPTR